jgi:hypothetical protein
VGGTLAPNTSGDEGSVCGSILTGRARRTSSLAAGRPSSWSRPNDRELALGAGKRWRDPVQPNEGAYCVRPPAEDGTYTRRGS